MEEIKCQVIRWWQTSKKKKKKTNGKNIFPISERRRQSKRISQYHLHTTKAAQARKKNHKEMEQKVRRGESSKYNEMADLRKH